ncbi:hypothetical protein LPJ53_005984 [Coemansia erecta]|uniref:RGS domain-containing protein n=1 Tax=Coemansia erecta TaxID=147472 RepID=A0A9W7XUG0_9FUNG|nr:hypothetical protein LPJ53_005984 [Coemansia erecta]
MAHTRGFWSGDRPPREAAGALRRSLSGDVASLGLGHGHGQRGSTRRAHQRAASASAAAAAPALSSAPPAATHGARFASAFRDSAWPGPRMRTATAAAAAGQAPESPAGSPPGSAATPPFRPRKRSLSVGGEQGCGAFFARQIDAYGLQALLASPVAVCYLLAAAVAGFSAESLLFYLEAEHFRSAPFASAARRLRYAKGLYKAFVSRRAPLEINISHAMRQRVVAAFRSDAPPLPPTLFAETQAHVYSLVEADFARFRQGALYGAMLAGLAAAAPARCSAASAAAAAVFDALAATYAVRRPPLASTRLAEAERPAFTKFADLDLTSADVAVALPAWLCRTTVRLLGALPPAAEAAAEPAAAEPAAAEPAAPAAKQKSLQRLRLRFQSDAAPPAAQLPSPPPSASAASPRFRWDALWSSRRRKQP